MLSPAIMDAEKFNKVKNIIHLFFQSLTEIKQKNK